MHPRKRAQAGFTGIELLVVLAVMGTAGALLMPGVGQVRAKQNQVAALAGIEQIALAQQLFRTSDMDGDLVDDYGTLAELGSLGLLPPGIAGGAAGGYAYSLQVSLFPSYEAIAQPLTPNMGVLRFFVDETGVVRFTATGTPGPASPVLPPGGECETPLTVERATYQGVLDFAARQRVRLADALGGGGHLPAAIDLVLSGVVVDELLLALDADADDAISPDEVLASDLLAVAQQVADGLGIPPGPVLGADADLAAILADYQASVSSELELAIDAPQPPVPLTDLLGQDAVVGAFLQSLGVPVPALPGPLRVAAALLLGVLAGAALRRRRARGSAGRSLPG